MWALGHSIADFISRRLVGVTVLFTVLHFEVSPNEYLIQLLRLIEHRIRRNNYGIGDQIANEPSQIVQSNEGLRPHLSKTLHCLVHALYVKHNICIDYIKQNVHTQTPIIIMLTLFRNNLYPTKDGVFLLPTPS